MAKIKGHIDYKKLGLRVRELRKSHGMTQAQVAERIDCAESFISHIETANTKPSLESLVRLSSLFHVPLDYFILDSPAVLPEVVINEEIGGVLSKYRPETLQTARVILSALLAQQEKLTKGGQ